LFWKGDPDLGPPGLLVVAHGSLHGADDHHFLSFMTSVLCVESRFLATLVSLHAGPRSSSRGSSCIHGGASPSRGNRESRRASPRRAGTSRGATRGGPRETSRPRESATGPQGRRRADERVRICAHERGVGGVRAKTRGPHGGVLEFAAAARLFGGRAGLSARSSNVCGAHQAEPCACGGSWGSSLSTHTKPSAFGAGLASRHLQRLARLAAAETCRKRAADLSNRRSQSGTIEFHAPQREGRVNDRVPLAVRWRDPPYRSIPPVQRREDRDAIDCVVPRADRLRTSAAVRSPFYLRRERAASANFGVA
jgi:hypothetical protein